jgi:hypothetical protein
VSFISFGEGMIVAANVWPMPGQPVGVELLRVDLRDYEREAHGTYFFPVRVGSHTRAILPEQLPMFIDARARKTAVILSRAIGSDLVLTVPKHEKKSFWRDPTLKLIDVSPQDNSVVVGLEGYRISLPLDLIEAAWIDGPRAYVTIHGYIDQLDSHGAESEPAESGGYIFVPLPRFAFARDAGR